MSGGWGFLGELDMDLAPLKDLYFIKRLKLMYYKPRAVQDMLIKSIHDVLGEYSRETRLILPAGLVRGAREVVKNQKSLYKPEIMF